MHPFRRLMETRKCLIIYLFVCLFVLAALGLHHMAWAFVQLWCMGFLLWCLLFLWSTDSRFCATWAQLPQGMRNVPGPGIEPLSPALTAGFSTTGPQGKSQDCPSCLISEWNVLDNCCSLLSGLSPMNLCLGLPICVQLLLRPFPTWSVLTLHSRNDYSPRSTGYPTQHLILQPHSGLFGC